MTRRDLLRAGAGLIIERPLPGAIEPQNLSYPLREIQGSVTPAEQFFVRDHFREPLVSLENWELSVEGRVGRPYRISFSDLLEFPTKRIEAVLECSGNGIHGSAASNGHWEGVPISYLLERARPSRDAAFVAFEGADNGKLFQGPSSFPYAQLVPLQKSLDAASLVAFKLNDLFLPRRNGFPARAFFPGWYAMASVKWLQRIVVLGADDRTSPFFQSRMDRVYNRVVLDAEGTRSERLSSLQVKSAIAWPQDKTRLPTGRYQIWGFAWTGSGSILEVTVSVDGGRRWDVAKLEYVPTGYGWTRWSYQWKAVAGDYSVLSRAKDSQGNQQPLDRDKSRKDVYEINWCAPLSCSVR